jgi:hypothetical protein
MFLTPLDILFTLFGLIVLTLLVVWIRNRNKDKSYYRYILPGFLFKVTFVLANCIFYIIVYKGGGDSIAFWDGSVKLNNLFWDNPLGYFEELWRSDEQRTLYKNFNMRTGYPPANIYSEIESFFVSKVASIFTFITFNGYLLMSLVFTFFSTLSTMQLFKLVRGYSLHSERYIALALFFIPSLSFWCGGISKDTLMWISVCYFIVHVHQIISVEKKARLWNWFIVLLTLYVMYRVRSFMTITVIIPLLFCYSVRITKKFGRGSLPSLGFKSLVVLLGIVGVFYFLQTSIANEYLEEAAVINKDMTYNKTYGTNRYNLGITEYSPFGFLKAAPASVIAGIFRPFIWESLNLSLILNGIESSVLLFFTFRLFTGGRLLRTITAIQSNEFLLFAFFFALILAFFAGFTSILFGVLVRFKAPVLPFLVLILSITNVMQKVKNEPSEVSEK